VANISCTFRAGKVQQHINISQKYGEEWWCQDKDFWHCYWKSIKSWVWTNNLAICSGHTAPKSTKVVLNVEWARHPPNKVPTIVHGQSLRIITWKLPSREYPTIHPLETYWVALWLEPWEPVIRIWRWKCNFKTISAKTVLIWKYIWYIAMYKK